MDFKEFNTEVTSFEIKIISEGQVNFQDENIGATFEEDILAKLRQAKSGDMIVFENIRCIYPGSSFPRLLADMIFYVSD